MYDNDGGDDDSVWQTLVQLEQDVTGDQPWNSEYTVTYYLLHCVYSWWRGTVVERRSLAGELSLSCARPAADG